jgi:hypothetical protein
MHCWGRDIGVLPFSDALAGVLFFLQNSLNTHTLFIRYFPGPLLDFITVICYTQPIWNMPHREFGSKKVLL